MPQPNEDPGAFRLVSSFNIDNGELEGIPPQDIFTAGYQLASVEEQLKYNRKAFRIYVYAWMQQRIRVVCKASDRKFSLTWLENDPSESWMFLSVEARP